MPNPQYLVVKDRVLAWFDRTENATAYEDMLLQLLAGETLRIQRHTGLTLFLATHTKYFDGDGDNVILLGDRPIVSVTSVHDDINRVYDASALLAYDTQYVWYETGRIIRCDGGVFSRGLKNVKVIFESGYSVIPEDVQLACLKQLAYDFQMRKKEHLGSEVVGASRSQSNSFLHEALLPEVESLLKSYVLDPT